MSRPDNINRALNKTPEPERAELGQYIEKLEKAAPEGQAEDESKARVTIELDRYSLLFDKNYRQGRGAERDQNGEWVRYADVKPFLTR